MATYVKFNNFANELAKGLMHLHAAGDTLNLYLTNATPNGATHTVKGDLADIANTGTYAPADAQNDISYAAGTATLTCVDKTWTASGASFGPFRYVILYNDTHASDALVAYWDYGSNITINDGESFTVDFGASVLAIS
jgi:hypothetical protein